MDTQLRPARPMDKMDAERWQEIVESDLFQVFVRRIRAELERAQDVCLRGDDELDLRRAQGAVKMAQTVLGLPELLAAEMRGGRRYISGNLSNNRA